MKTSPVDETPAELILNRPRTRPSRVSLAIGVFFGAVVCMAFSLPLLDVNDYWITISYTVAFYIALGQAWNLLSGFTGYLSFAHGAILGIGSYTAGIASNSGLGYFPALLAAAFAGVVLSLLIGLPSLRLKGIAFAFATIFFQSIALLAVEKADTITGGPSGLVFETLESIDTSFYSMLALAVVATLAVFILRRSRLGLQLLAIREDELAARISGLPVTRLKMQAFTVSAVLAAVVGGVHGFYLATLYPQSVFDLQTSLEALVIPLVGGPATAVGPGVIAVVYVVFQESLRGMGSALQLSLLGVVVVAVVLIARGGLAELASSLRTRWLIRKGEV